MQAQRKMADHKVDDGLKKEIEAGKTLKDTPVPETGVNTHDATLAGNNLFHIRLSKLLHLSEILRHSSPLFLRNHPFQQGQNEHSEFHLFNLWCILYPVRERRTDLFALVTV